MVSNEPGPGSGTVRSIAAWGHALLVAVAGAVASPAHAASAGAQSSASRSSSPAAATAEVTRYVSVDKANYRKGPSTNYPVVGTYWKGTTVVGTLSSSGVLKMTNGYYISGTVVTSTKPGTMTRYVAANKANYRKGPSTSYAVVGTYPKRTKLTGIISAYGYLKMANGYYISGSVLSPTPPPPPTTRWVKAVQANYRSGPGTGYRVVGSYWQGAPVGGTLTGTGWLKMTNGYYISEVVLRATAPATVTRYVSVASANYRKGPTTAYGVLGQYERGTKVTGTVSNNGTLRIGANGFHISGAVLTTTPNSTTTQVTQHVAVRWGDVYTGASTASTRIDYAPRGGVVKGTVSGGWMRIGPSRYIRMAQLTNNSYSYNDTNGRINPTSLCHLPIPDKEHRFIKCGGATSGLRRLNVAFKARFGHNLEIDECYRSYASQVFYREEFGTKAAVPGYSNHGTAVACDLLGNDARYGFGTPREQWMVAHGPAYGWERPDFMDEGGSNPEYWHFEYVD